MTTIYLPQGPSGSGKSTWAEKLKVAGAHVVSADYVHLGDDGVWRFDPKRLGFGHQECMRAFIKLCGMSPPPAIIIVDNTNINAWEYAPYVRVAEALLKEPAIKLMVFMRDLKKCVQQNVHGVPDNVIRSMQSQLLTGMQLPGIAQEFIFVD